MVAALAHDLSEKRGVSSTLLHYPSFVIDVKNAIGDGNVKTLVDEIKLAEVLILDDHYTFNALTKKLFGRTYSPGLYKVSDILAGKG